MYIDVKYSYKELTRHRNENILFGPDWNHMKVPSKLVISTLNRVFLNYVITGMLTSLFIIWFIILFINFSYFSQSEYQILSPY